MKMKLGDKWKSAAGLENLVFTNDQLDKLSEKEKKVTGRNVNYKQSDINNVLIIPRILRQEQAEG